MAAGLVGRTAEQSSFRLAGLTHSLLDAPQTLEHRGTYRGTHQN